jgi:hypothetical protein
MPSKPPIPFELIATAQELVDRWRRSPKREPFDRFIERAETELRGRLLEDDRQAAIFRRIAHAIRVGVGHAYANPRPLRDLAERLTRR